MGATWLKVPNIPVIGKEVVVVHTNVDIDVNSNAMEGIVTV